MHGFADGWLKNSWWGSYDEYFPWAIKCFLPKSELHPQTGSELEVFSSATVKMFTEVENAAFHFLNALNNFEAAFHCAFWVSNSIGYDYESRDTSGTLISSADLMS